MADVALIAAVALTYRGRALEAGDRFEAAPVEAALLTYRHLARFARDVRPAETPAAEAPAKGRIKRRDVRPED